ncbi:MAG TPA: hypothetical protein IAA54_00855 [Candidatus Gallacutalibacter pullicola]|uniref:Uncharacterized protein n=1 Tax=Candidatus Gallacutalibacter pullicola TaxID=2840830 RepID=A0A9D1J092_9FIRM|nr:hypothetical protein [Candidatus Gallacutalibacter pullicola]
MSRFNLGKKVSFLMQYQAGDMLLSTIGTLFRGSVNDVLVCTDLNSPYRPKYLLLLLHDRACIRRLVSVFDEAAESFPQKESPYLVCFSDNELMGFVFPYREERLLSSYAPGQAVTPQLQEQLCISLTVECMASALPFPLLYLALKQGQVHLEKDGSVYIIPALDLAKLDPAMGESDCAYLCANQVLEILRLGGRRRLDSRELVEKKIANSSYNTFHELYYDIRVSSLPLSKPGFRARLRSFWDRHKDQLFRLLLVVCVVLVVLTVLFLLSQLIFGEIPFLRLFQDAFETIGTEDLTMT